MVIPGSSGQASPATRERFELEFDSLGLEVSIEVSRINPAERIRFLHAGRSLKNCQAQEPSRLNIRNLLPHIASRKEAMPGGSFRADAYRVGEAGSK